MVIIIMIEVSTLKVATIMCSIILTKVVVLETISTLKGDIVLIRIAKRKKINNLIDSSLKFKKN